MSSADSAKVMAFVAVDPLAAFEVFTQETDLWWRKGPKYRFAGTKRGVLTFEPGKGGRLVEKFEEGGEFEAGKILAWEPGVRLVFEWHISNFAPGERTEVEVRFEKHNNGTRVTLEHRGWDALRADHPARHGLEGNAFVSMIGLWWGDQLTMMRAHAEQKG
jgi:uncharacterized protein YndB with AHSA1/START domain